MTDGPRERPERRTGARPGRAGPDHRRPPIGRARLRGRGGWIGVAMALLTAVYAIVLAADAMPSMVHGDGYYTYLWARTIVWDGDLDFHDDYNICGDPWGLRSEDQGDGQDINYWQPGGALYWVPILAFDRLTDHPALSSSSTSVSQACRGPLAERAVRGSIVAGLFAMLVGMLLARRHFGEGPAIFGAAAIGLLGPLLYYSTMLGSYSHAASSTSAGLVVLAWDRLRIAPSRKGWILCGAALGFSMLTRAQNAIFVVLPLATWLLIAARSRDWKGFFDHVLSGVLFTVALIVLFFPQLWFWHEFTGSWITVPQGSVYMRWGESMPHKALFSAQGLFAWGPVHYLAVAGFFALAMRKKTRALGIGMFVMLALESWVVGSVYDWWGSVGFPGRRFDALAVPFMLGVAALGREVVAFSERRRGSGAMAVAGALIVLLGFWNIGVSAGVARGMRTDTLRQSPVQWQDTHSRVSRSLWLGVGNPLLWPASLPFAAHWGVHPRRWDILGGPELFYHVHHDGAWVEDFATVRFDSPVFMDYFDGRVGPEPSAARGHRGMLWFTGSVRGLIPLHWPEVGRIAFKVTSAVQDTPARISARLNGRRLDSVRVRRDGEVIYFDVPRGVGVHGTNVLWLWIEDSPVIVEAMQILDAHQRSTLR